MAEAGTLSVFPSFARAQGPSPPSPSFHSWAGFLLLSLTFSPAQENQHPFIKKRNMIAGAGWKEEDETMVDPGKGVIEERIDH